MRGEPCVRWGERDGDGDDGNESGDGDAGYVEFSEYAYEYGELHCGRAAKRDWAGDDGDLDGIDDGGDADGQCGVDGIDGVYGEVLVRGELARNLTESQPRRAGSGLAS